MQVYFSHSYREVDSEVNSFFMSAMKNLGWKVIVDPPSPSILYEKIAKHIEDSDLVVVAVTRRELDAATGEWLPSPWISQEIGMSMMARVPLLVYVEEGVRVGDLVEEVHYERFARDRLAADRVLIIDRLRKLGDSVSAAKPPEPQHDPFAFVVMKFDDSDLDDAYELAIRPAIEAAGLKSIRVDKISVDGTITDEIINSIQRCMVVVADLTGERPNCYYEVGFAHASGRPVVLTIRKGEKIHFDLVTRQFLIWDTKRKLKAELEDRIKRILTTSRA